MNDNLYKTGELYKVMETFERSYQGRSRMDKEVDKEWWKRGHYYQNGDTNFAFNQFLSGYMFAKLNMQLEENK